MTSSAQTQIVTVEIYIKQISTPKYIIFLFIINTLKERFLINDPISFPHAIYDISTTECIDAINQSDMQLTVI